MIVFGDSYGHPYSGEDLWYNALDCEYNFCLKGTGPHYCLKQIEKNRKLLDGNDIVILYSNYLRYDFDFLKSPSHSTTVNWIYCNYGPLIEYKFERKKWDEGEYDEKKYLLEYCDLIKRTLDSVKDTFEQDFFNIIDEIDSNILVIPCFEKPSVITKKTIADIVLHTISEQEFDKYQVYCDIDIRYNHLCIDNHKKLQMYIKHYFDTGELLKIEFTKGVYKNDNY